MKIDIFCHVFPKKFYDRMLVLPERGVTIKKRVTEIPSLVDLDVRFRIMDEFRDYIQVPCMPLPPDRSPRRSANNRRNSPKSPMTAWPSSSPNILIALPDLWPPCR